MNMMRTSKQLGFTLVEAIIVIVLTGIIVGFIALFLRQPVKQYQDLSSRSELTDIANTAMRRMSREMHLALPNSVRSANSSCIEFVPTYDGGRYRSVTDGSGAGNVFTTEQAITRFDVIGPLAAAPSTGDYVVVYNLGVPGADVYAAANRATIGGTLSTSTLNFSSFKFPFESPAKKFFLVSGTEQAVSYVCSGVGLDSKDNGTGKLYRVAAYGFNAAPACPSTTGAPILAQNVSECVFQYSTGVREQNGLAAIRLKLSKSVLGSHEDVSLYFDVNINNVP